MYLFAGYSDDTRALLDHLRAEAPGMLGRIVIVDRDPRLADRLAPLGVTVVHGDPDDLATLMEAGAPQAQMVVVFPASPPTDRAHRVVESLRRLCAVALYVDGGPEWAIDTP